MERGGRFRTVAAAVPVVGWLCRPSCGGDTWRQSILCFPSVSARSQPAMAVSYYLVLTPIGLVMRLLGHDPLNRRWDRTAKSYWTKRTPPENTERYFRQF